LYKGASLGLMRDVPFFGINLLVYEQLRAAALVRAQALVLSDGGSAELSTMATCRLRSALPSDSAVTKT